MPLSYGWHQASALLITPGSDSTDGEYLLPSGLRRALRTAFSGMEKRQSTRRPHHAVLRIQHPRLIPVPLKKRRLHAKTLAEVVVDHRPQLFVIPKQNNLEQRVDTSAVRVVVVLVKAISSLKGYLLLLIYVMVTATSAKDLAGHYTKILTQTTQSLVPI